MVRLFPGNRLSATVEKVHQRVQLDSFVSRVLGCRNCNLLLVSLRRLVGSAVDVQCGTGAYR